MKLQRSHKLPIRGFTLVELMVVLAILAIVTASILPQMKGAFEEALLRSTARRLAQFMSLAHSQAVTLNTTHRVRFNRQDLRYMLERRAMEEEEASGFVPAAEALKWKGRIDERIRVEFLAASESEESGGAPGYYPNPALAESGDPLFVFHPDGTAEANGLLLRDRDGFGLALKVHPATSRIRVEEAERL